MSAILEALDAMYEVKGEDVSASYFKKDQQNAQSRRGWKKNDYESTSYMRNKHDPYNVNVHQEPMKTASDYRTRKRDAESYNSWSKGISDRKAERRAKKKAANECTETIDTLDMIL